LLYIDVKQLQKNVFQFPLQIKINSSGKKEKIFIDKTAVSFKIKTDQKPTSVVIDPDTELLMNSTVKEK